MLDFKSKLNKAIVDNFIKYNVNPNSINNDIIIEFDEKNQIHHINSTESKSNLNVVVSKNLETKEQINKATEIIKPYQDKKIPLTWCIVSDTKETAKKEFFQEKGFIHAETMIAMVINLEQFNSEMQLNENEKFTDVATLKDVDNFLAVIKKSFSLVLIDIQKYYGIFEMRQKEKFDYLTYLSVANIPISTGHFYFEDDYVFIDDIATSPEFQNRGYGKKMLQHLLATAKAMDYKHAALIATPEGFPFYLKLGFQPLDLYFDVYALNYSVI